MKMAGHQTKGNNISMWQNVLPDFVQKEQVVVTIEENSLRVISPIINVIQKTLFEKHNLEF